MDEIDRKSSILIVDDSAANTSYLRNLLRTEYAVKATSKPEKAIQAIQSKNSPDLIILNAAIPGIEEYDLCRRLKADPQTWNTSVIFITENWVEEETKLFKMGAADYITKPFNSAVIKARVQAHSELKKYRDTLENSYYRDSLTTIPNRKRFDEYYDSVWNFAVRESMPLSLIMIDVDNFNNYLDKNGSQEADSCLVRIAKKLSSTIRRKTDQVARFGVEQFICVLSNTRIDGAITIAEGFRTGIMSLKIPASEQGYMTISQGVATITPTKESFPQDLINAATEALEKSGIGRNQINCKSI